MIFEDIKNDFDLFEKETNIYTTYLVKDTKKYMENYKGIGCYTYITEEVEENDDVVDCVRVNFLLNVYVSSKLLNSYDKIYKALEKFGFYDIKFMGTVRENFANDDYNEPLCYNMAFSFYKLYYKKNEENEEN